MSESNGHNELLHYLQRDNCVFSVCIVDFHVAFKVLGGPFSSYMYFYWCLVPAMCQTQSKNGIELMTAYICCD